MSAAELKAKTFEWFDERLGLRMARDLLDHKVVPLHPGTAWYYFGGITLFLFGVQMFTGLLLLLYYRPTVAEAFDSVRFIMTRVEFGWLIRSIHSWSANLLIFFAFVHMFSVMFTHSYRRPRELTWLSGIALLGLMLGFGFSGYLLPWNQISYFATKVGTDVAGTTPVIGPVLARFLRGGEEVGAATLTRFFAFHVMILPLITGGLRRTASAAGAEGRHEHPKHLPPQNLSHMKFFPNFFLRELMVWYGVLACWARWPPFFPGNWVKRPIPSPPLPPAFAPNGTSWRSSTRSS